MAPQRRPSDTERVPGLLLLSVCRTSSRHARQPADATVPFLPRKSKPACASHITALNVPHFAGEEGAWGAGVTEPGASRGAPVRGVPSR